MRAAIIGSGPNGLSAAIRLAQAGLKVNVYEADHLAGGGTSSAELTLPGFVHDRGSAIHPLAVSSPFFASLPLAEHGLKWIYPPTPLAHPLDEAECVTLDHDLGETARRLGADGEPYRQLIEPLVRVWPAFVREVLRPLPAVPRHPFRLADFGWKGIEPASVLARTMFHSPRAQALFAGCAAHSFLRLEQLLSSAFGMILAASAHGAGWPLPQGGSQAIANALWSLLRQLGGKVHLSSRITSLDELDAPDITLCDITPRQFLRMASERLPWAYRHALSRYRYGPGVFKVDWALSEPIPWRDEACRRAGTVHVAGSYAEIAASERAIFGDTPAEKPFIILAQPTLFDPTRAPPGKHIAWAYSHVPHGWKGSHLKAIEDQVERFAPGFRDCVLARHTAGPADLERWNANLVGGDINGGMSDWRQFFLRPTVQQYRTLIPGVYLCSASTPPTGGVHGMCGFHAAEKALAWLRTRKNSKLF